MALNNNYSNSYANYHRAVVQLEQNLQYMKDKGVSDKFLSIQREVIKALKTYKAETERYLSELEMENFRLANGKIKELDQLKETKESLEAICIIHGIMDFPAWMQKGNRYLVNEAVQSYRNDMMQLPEKLKEWIDTLNEYERAAIDRILFKEYHRTDAELKQQLQQILHERQSKQAS